MPRRFQLFAFSLTAAALIAVFTAPGCGDECSRVDDCAYREVCYKGVCTPSSASYVRCTTDFDCNPDGQFACVASRCQLRSTTSTTGTSTIGP